MLRASILDKRKYKAVSSRFLNSRQFSQRIFNSTAIAKEAERTADLGKMGKFGRMASLLDRWRVHSMVIQSYLQNQFPAILQERRAPKGNQFPEL